MRARPGPPRTRSTRTICAGPSSSTPGSREPTCFNAVKAIYVDPDKDYQLVDAPPVTKTTYEAQDNGERIWKNLELPFTTSVAMAQRLAKIELERTRQQIGCVFRANLTALRIQAWDVIQVSNTRLGWTNKEFRVISWKITDDLGIDLLLREEAASAWSWSAEETTVDLAPDTTLPDVWSVSPPGGCSFDEETSCPAPRAPSSRCSP